MSQVFGSVCPSYFLAWLRVRNLLGMDVARTLLRKATGPTQSGEVSIIEGVLSCVSLRFLLVGERLRSLSRWELCSLFSPCSWLRASLSCLRASMVGHTYITTHSIMDGVPAWFSWLVFATAFSRWVSSPRVLSVATAGIRLHQVSFLPWPRSGLGSLGVLDVLLG